MPTDRPENPWISAAAVLLATALIGGGIPWGAGLMRFADTIPREVADPNSHTDAIVVLTGGSERLTTGLSLLAEHKAERVFVSGVHPTVGVERLVKLANSDGTGQARVEEIGAATDAAADDGSSETAGERLDAPRAAAIGQRIDAGYGAKNTQGNAEETAAWMHGHGYHSLRLVTGSYHMPRSLLEFHVALPDAVVIPHPVFPKDVKQTSWWFRPGTAALIISEYNKYLLARVEHWAQRIVTRPPGGRSA
ncbi:MAG: YdcF family protein [Rhodospirillales bacterium]|nr:YdcF family protein [Rhodospirillales bacterium]